MTTVRGHRVGPMAYSLVWLSRCRLAGMVSAGLRSADAIGQGATPARSCRIGPRRGEAVAMRGAVGRVRGARQPAWRARLAGFVWLLGCAVSVSGLWWPVAVVGLRPCPLGPGPVRAGDTGASASGP